MKMWSSLLRTKSSFFPLDSRVDEVASLQKFCNPRIRPWALIGRCFRDAWGRKCSYYFPQTNTLLGVIPMAFQGSGILVAMLESHVVPQRWPWRHPHWFHDNNIWLWVKKKTLGDHRFWSIFCFTNRVFKVAFFWPTAISSDNWFDTLKDIMLWQTFERVPDIF